MSIAKNTFGNLNNKSGLINQSDYISKKKKNTINQVCVPYHIKQIKNIHANKNNIVSGLYFTTDLTNVCVVSDRITNTCPIALDYTSQNPFYFDNIIDPQGLLFENNIRCGINKYKNYMKFTR